jgi:hypothetical protein
VISFDWMKKLMRNASRASTGRLAAADGTRETAISGVQTAIVPADGMSAAIKITGLRHDPLAAHEEITIIRAQGEGDDAGLSGGRRVSYRNET